MTGNNKPETMDPFNSRDHIQHLVRLCVEHLVGQIKAGCDTVQIFDSWASDLDEDFIIDYCFDPTAQIVSEIKTRYPDVGVIAFPRLIGREIRNFTAWCDPYIDCINLSGDVPFKYCYKHLESVSLQGGIDPDCLLSIKQEHILQKLLPVLRITKDIPYVVNLAHGVNKDTPVENVKFLVDCVKRHRKYI